MNSDLSVHLRQLNNPANAHANAEHPVLFVTPSEEHQTPTDGTMISAIQIHGPLVGWLLHRKVYYLHYIEIWDWQAGHALWVSIPISGSKSPYIPILTWV